MVNSSGERDTAAGLSVVALRKSFPTRAGELVVLDGVDLAVPAGGTLAITGPSGCGKSTLLHILGTLDRPSGGSVWLEGVGLFTLADAALARLRNRSIGFVFQDHHLLPQCSVLENVLMPTLASAEPPAGIEERAAGLLDRVGLSERQDHLPAELSGGERQRVAIARALILNPLLVLCDEPTGNLDRSTARIVADLLLEVQREERAMLIVVTHSLELAGRFDRRAELDGGRLRE